MLETPSKTILRKTGQRGTAAMSPETRTEVARAGGLSTAKNRSHMALIGRRGGLSVSQDRAHMAAIGKKGGSARRMQQGGAQ